MEDPSSKKKPYNNQLWRYAGLAFQMMAAIGIALWGGYKLDQWTGMPFPLFMIIFSLLALALLLWQIVKDTGKHDR
ncbi:ATPase F0F1 [Chitinophaga alhagiae]|uniref:ATPase F0F1 n=1 Tax=Chitinophaga alhagiae TaxID=2203219 RepID=A0ABN5LMY1_9BACT|nr:AtpZ/AtpI family protein [Chitinophaga alhagiae]AWO00599.1 ATPase F0F1 [Chitinophaga alhagiae]